MLHANKSWHLQTLGFGVPATSKNPHHFRVFIPKKHSEKISIREYLGIEASKTEESIIKRATLDFDRWSKIEGALCRSFNARLRSYGLKTSKWKAGENLVERLLGRELCVLVWGVEQIKLEKIPAAIHAWNLLRPEDKWWLYGMAASANRGTGWRGALCYMLCNEFPEKLLVRED